MPTSHGFVVVTAIFAGVALAPITACKSAPSTTAAPSTDAGTTDAPVTETVVRPNAAPAPECTTNADCPSKICTPSKKCAEPTTTDGVKNGNETDIDCGGDAPKCDVEKSCAVAGDCQAGVCKDIGSGLRCLPPSDTDGVKNGSETGIDCGGLGHPKCAEGQTCSRRDDCASDYCKTNVCTAPTPGDGDQNGTETDVDCGGHDAPRCDDLEKCLVADDCRSSVCKDADNGHGMRCQVPTATDLVTNGTETDVDCGGASAPACAKGKGCLAATDCTTGGCNYANKCASARSCTAHYGGDTCGLTGVANDDCCATAPVTTPLGGTVYMDKYQTTAGRMRAFMESIDYDVRGFVQSARARSRIPNMPGTTNALLAAGWDAYLPTSFLGTDADAELADCDQADFDVAYGVCCQNPPPAPGCPAGSTLEHRSG